MMRKAVSIIVAVAFLVGCGSKLPPDVIEDNHPKIKPGISQARVLDLLGQPNDRRMLVKTETPGFGYPSWWDKEMNIGDKAEQWIYRTDEGLHEIYFLKGHQAVGHTRFVPKGIVF